MKMRDEGRTETVCVLVCETIHAQIVSVDDNVSVPILEQTVIFTEPQGKL